MDIQWRGQAPKYTRGRQGTRIDRIVIHRIFGTLGSADSVFLSGSRGTSCHYGIGHNGVIYQWVRDEDTAYHAGNWGMNLRSIGIEHEDKQTETYTDAEYKASNELVAELSRRHGITLDRAHVIKHNEVKATACPGIIDIFRIIRGAQQGGGEFMTESEVNDAYWDLSESTYVKLFGRSLQATEGDAGHWREVNEMKRLKTKLGAWHVAKFDSGEAQDYLKRKYGSNPAIVDAVKRAKEILAPF
jgi:coenzyme F420-reducing hydrogenase delta subunit